MPSIDLTPYGFACKVEGQTLAQRRQRFVFLFNETHTNYQIIRQNLLNACILIDGDFISCIGVEGIYDLEGMTPEDIEAESKSQFAEHGDDLALIDFFIRDAQAMDQEDPGRPHFFFGTCIKLLRPSVSVKCVENDELHAEADRIQDEINAKHAKVNGVSHNEFCEWIRKGTNKEATEKAKTEYRKHEVHLRREQAFVTNLLEFWKKVGGEKAAILNAGRAHLTRIAATLPVEVTFIQIDQPS